MREFVDTRHPRLLDGRAIAMGLWDMNAAKRNKRILLIDDNLSFLKSIRLALDKAGFICQITQDIEEALNHFKMEHFDLIICDYFMPAADGKSVLNWLGDLRQDCQLILTSAYPLDLEFKKSECFTFVDKLGLLDWVKGKYVEIQYVR